MGDKIIEKLFISIGVDAKDVSNEIRDVVNNVTKSLKSYLNDLVPKFASLWGAFALAIGNFVKNTFAEVLALDKLSETLGTNVERLQMWQEATKDAGIATEEIGKLWEHLGTQINDAVTKKGGNALSKFVDEGVLPSFQTMDGQIKETEAYLLELADAFSKMDTKTASLVGKRIGIGNSEMMEFLREGSGSINQKLDHIKMLGIYTKEDVKITKDFDKALKEMRASLNDVGRRIRSLLMPVYRALIPVLTTASKYVKDFTKHIEVLYPAVAVLAGLMLKSLIPAIKGIGTALAGLILKHPYLLAIAAALTLIGIVFEDVWGYFHGKKSVTGEFLKEFEGFGDAVGKGIMNALVIFTDFIEQIQNGLWGLVHSVEAGVNLALQFFETLWGTIGKGREVSEEAWNSMREAASNFFSPVIKWADTLAEKLGIIWNFLKNSSFVGGIIKGASNLLSRTNSSSNIDNSQHNVDSKTNLTVNVGSVGEAKQLLGGYTSPTLGGFNNSYGGVP